MAALLKMINPDVDWEAAMVALKLTKKKPTTKAVSQPVTTPIPSPTTEPLDEPINYPEAPKSHPASPKISENLKIPLDVSPLSYYIPPIEISDGEGDKKEGEVCVEEVEGEKGENREVKGEKGENREVEGDHEAEKCGGVDEGVKDGDDVEMEETDVEKVEEIENGGKGDVSAKQGLTNDEEFAE